MTARDEAIEAGAEAMRDYYGYEPVSGSPTDSYWIVALDAIPADVLARYAIERGGLIDDGSWVRPNNPDDYLVHYEDEDRPDDAVTLYRLVETDQ